MFGGHKRISSKVVPILMYFSEYVEEMFGIFFVLVTQILV